MFELTIEAAKALISSAGMLNKLGKERRTNLATYFDEISKVMREYVDIIEGGGEPPPLCKKLAKLAKSIRDVAGHTLKSDEVENACSNWRKLDRSDTPGNTSYKDCLNELLSTAGSFEGAAIVLRAK
jgi:hypothetical protein